MTGGRNGHVRSADGVLDFELRPPKEMGGPGGSYTNPEELFAAGYAACFNSALMLVARRKKLNADNAEVTASVSIGRDTDGASYKLEAVISATFYGIDPVDAKTLMHEAHGLCPYSKATHGNMEVELHFTTK